MEQEYLHGRATALRARLQARGMAVVIVSYDGEGGDGAIESIEGLTDAKTPIPVSEEEFAEIAGFFEEILESRWPDWTAEYGSSGTFRWSFESNELVNEHYVRVVRYHGITLRGWQTTPIRNTGTA